MSDTQFQELYNKYSNSFSENIKEECKSVLHQHVYVYPIRRFRTDPETASEFYIHMYNKINLLFNEYDPNFNISFYTFLSVKLRNHYLYFYQKTNKEKEKNYTLSYDALEVAPEKNIILEDTNTIQAQEEDETLWDRMRQQLLEVLARLKKDDQLIVRLYYGFSLTLEQFRLLLQKHKSFQVFNIYKDYLIKIKDWEINQKAKKEKLREKLAQVKEKLNDLNEQENPKSFEKYQNKQEKLIQQFIDSKAPFSFKYIALLVKKTLGFVYNTLKKIKKEIKKLLQFK